MILLRVEDLFPKPDNWFEVKTPTRNDQKFAARLNELRPKIVGFEEEKVKVELDHLINEYDKSWKNSPPISWGGWMIKDKKLKGIKV